MQHKSPLSKALWYVILFSFSLSNCILSYAIIPASITGTHFVNANDNCPTNCTIQNGGTLTISGGTTTATFNGTITIMPGGTVNIQSGATLTANLDLTIKQGAILNMNSANIRMAAGRRIIVEHSTSGTLFGAEFNIDNGSLVTSVSSSPTGGFWQGIEYANNMTINSDGQGTVNLNNSTIECAICAVTTFNPSLNIGYGGRIFAKRSTFRNNVRSVRIEQPQNGQVPIGGNPDGHLSIENNFNNCTFVLTSNFGPVPADMVFIRDAIPVKFDSCTFQGKATGYDNTIGINLINSGLTLGNANEINRPSRFINLRTGINATNTLTAHRVLIRNAGFLCRYGITLSGCNYPLVTGCGLDGYSQFTQLVCAIFLRNSTGYRIEGNNINYDVQSNVDSFAGIIALNSGIANNEVYRNTIVYTNLAMGAYGTNKSLNGTTGLKFLCNSITASYDNDIIVMPDISSNNGIHNSQFVQLAGGATRSAGNNFSPNNAWAYRNYYLAPNTNNLNQFQYLYDASGYYKTPVYRNFPNILTSTANTCPVQIPGSPLQPMPFGYFVTQLNAIESAINTIESNNPNNTAADTQQLEYLLQEHSALIDSIIIPLYSKNEIDSMIMVYEQVSIGYHYKLLLAAAKAAANRYNEVAAVLDNILANYALSGDEAQQINQLIIMYEVQKWLYENNNNWDSLPPHLYEAVNETEQSDAMYAGSIARMLLAAYEGKIYEPYFTLPDIADSILSSTINSPSAYLDYDNPALPSLKKTRIYPNPTFGSIAIDQPNAGAMLQIYDIKGTLLRQQKLEAGTTLINIGALPSGIYLAEIHVNGKKTFSQKISRH